MKGMMLWARRFATVYGIINNGVLVEELSAEELAERSREGLKIKVDDKERAQAILKQNGVTDVQIKKHSILIHVDADRAAEINALLVSNGIAVSELTVRNTGFEDYFIERLGK